MSDRTTHSDDDFRILHPLFAISIALGLFEVARPLVGAWLNEPTSGDVWGPIVWTAMGIALTATGLRFTWAVEALSRYLRHEQTKELSQGDKDKLYKKVTVVCYPVLFLHAFVFFSLCIAVRNLIDPSLGSSSVEIANRLFATLLLLNVVYLPLVMPSTKDFANLTDEQRNNPDLDNRAAKMNWLFNNGVFGLLAIVSSFFPQAGLIPLIVIIVANSAIDLWRSAPYYVPRM